MWPVWTWIALIKVACRTKDSHSAGLSFCCLVQKDVKYNSTVVVGFCGRLQRTRISSVRVTRVLPCPKGCAGSPSWNMSAGHNSSLASVSSSPTSKEVKERGIACSWSWEREASREHLTSLALMSWSLGHGDIPSICPWKSKKGNLPAGIPEGYSYEKTVLEGMCAAFSCRERVVSGGLLVDSAQQESKMCRLHVPWHPERGKGCQWPVKKRNCCLDPTRFLRLWDFPGKNTGVGCYFLLQGIFPTQGLNLGFPHCRQTFYGLSHQESHVV